MEEKNKNDRKAAEKLRQHKKSTDTSKVKNGSTKDKEKKFQKTGEKYDDWNDPTGNTHLSDKT
jgi:hypothetical protein